MNVIPVLLRVRSAYNVGSVMRSAEGLGCNRLISVGITPHLRQPEDKRLPHVIDATEKKIAKTALGAQHTLSQRHFADFESAVRFLKDESYVICALEQDERSVDIAGYRFAEKTALILGPEKAGMTAEELAFCSDIVEIPMQGEKQSLNVASAAAIALYAAARQLT